MKVYDRIIIGAGLYGLYSALFCGMRKESVLVLECDSAPFKRATYINQARVHQEYHYPRSLSTALKSAGYFERFNKDYSFCVNREFQKVYATSSQYSWSNGEQFKNFCKAAGIPCEELHAERFFKRGMCDGAFLTKEYTYDAMGKNSGGLGNGNEGEGSGKGGDNGNGEEKPPIAVDFHRLQEMNGDVAGWIYCEGTPINYPVMKGADNDFYLGHSYDGANSRSGSIFVEAANRPGFADANTILYGHHMKDGSMFASLEKWADQEFYEEHPVMWLFTPKQDYKVILFSGYTTSANSEAYTIFSDSGKELEEYLEKCIGKSDFEADVSDRIQEEGTGNIADKYIVLSTCSYVFEDARYVIHGFLVPVG